jgi:flagella basal body P-ring formation protein FlgA
MMTFQIPLVSAKAETQNRSMTRARRNDSNSRRDTSWTRAFAGASGGLMLLLAAPAFAAPVELKAELLDDDGRITLGDLFDGAGAASAVQVGTRTGASAVLDAGKLQLLARRAGLEWPNAQGLRRLIVRAADTGQTAATATLPAASVRAQPVIRKGEAVTVRFDRGGVVLTLQGKAMEAAAPGQSFSVLNPASKKVVEAVAAGPGRAVAGAEADRLKAEQFASR